MTRRIAVLTPLIPTPEDPFRGKPIHRTLLELQKLVEVKIFCPMAVYPPGLQPRSFRYHRTDLNKPLDSTIPTQLFEYHTVPVLGRPFNSYLCCRQALPLVRAYQPDMVLAFWVYPEGQSALWTAQALGIPSVLFARGSDIRRLSSRYDRWQMSRTIRQANGLLTVSEDLRRIAVSLGVPSDQVLTIPNGCDTTLFYPRPAVAMRQLLNLPQDHRIILFVGHLQPHKGVLALAKAFVQTAREDSQARLVYIGDGPLHGDLESLFAAASLQDRVTFLEPVSPQRVGEWMSAADVLCLASDTEGCPNVVIEAQSCGVPVVATRVGGTPELIRPETGILVPAPADPDQLAKALLEALRRTWDRQQISVSCQRSWADVASETFEFCQSVMQKSHAHG